MKSLLDVPVSIGKSLHSADVERGSLGSGGFEKHAVFDGKAEDKNGAYFCAGLMRDNRRSRNRIARCVLIVIDADNLTARQDEKMTFLLEETKLEHIVYTTTRHTPDNPRKRLIFNPSRPMSIDEYRHVTRRICEEFAIDAPCKATLNPASPMLYPLCLAGNEPEASITHAGDETVDVDLYTLDAVLAPDDEDEGNGSTLMPMAIPGALSDAAWYQSILTAAPAKGCEYDEWLEMGMALHHQTYAKQFELWYKWSELNEEKHGRQFDHAGMKGKWDGFKSNPDYKGVTMRKILNYWETFDGCKLLSAVYATFMDNITNPADLKRLQVDIQDDKYLVGDKDYNAVIKAYVKAVKRCSNEKISLGDAVVALKPEHAIGGLKNYFYNNYLFRATDTSYVSIKDRTELPRESMNFRYGSRMPRSNAGARKVVHKVLTEESNGYVKPREIHGMTYVIHGKPVIEEQGRIYLNRFNPDSWPEIATAFNKNVEIDAVIRDMILKHMRLLGSNDKPTIELLVKHLAHLRQKPNRRIHWGYAISSIFQGVGKSTLQRIYRIVLGDEQVNTLSSGDIIDPFNQFASAPKLMSFIEEFEYTTTRERNKAIKNLKDYITSDVVSIRRMARAASAEIAHTAYALFSNDEYVLGHESIGRRWVPITVQAMNDEQCEEILGENHLDFYARYHALMDEYPERFTAYFDSIDIEGFDTERPPKLAKSRTHAENTPQARVMRLLRDMIDEQRTISITADYVCSSVAKTMIESEININNSVDAEELRHINPMALRNIVNTALRGMGYRVAHNSKARVRIPLPEKDRVTMDDLYVKSAKRYGGLNGVRRLKHRIKNESKTLLHRVEPDIDDDEDTDMDSLDF